MRVKVEATNIDHVYNWIENKKANLSDLKPLWNILKPIVLEKSKEEFSDANPNNWKPLSHDYLKWKIQMGYPTTIGVATGKLKQAATASAIVTEDKSSFNWKLDSKIPVQGGVSYSSDFNKRRPIFKYTRVYLKKTVYEAAQRWIKSIIGK